MLINPLQHLNPMVTYLTVAYKYFPKKDVVLHTELEKQPDFIINDNQITVIFLEMGYHIANQNYIIEKVKAVRKYYPTEQLIILCCNE